MPLLVLPVLRTCISLHVCACEFWDFEPWFPAVTTFNARHGHGVFRCCGPLSSILTVRVVAHIHVSSDSCAHGPHVLF